MFFYDYTMGAIKITYFWQTNGKFRSRCDLESGVLSLLRNYGFFVSSRLFKELLKSLLLSTKQPPGERGYVARIRFVCRIGWNDTCQIVVSLSHLTVKSYGHYTLVNLLLKT